MSTNLFIFVTLGFLITNLLWRLYRTTRFAAAPGPDVAKYTKVWYAWKVWQGQWEKLNIKLHRQHGKIVRVGPGMYSIDDPAAMKSIYGIGTDMMKTSWYSAWGQPGVPDHNLFSARNRTFHAGMRRKQASLYSMSAIKAYEPFVDSTTTTLCGQLDTKVKLGETIDLQRWMQCYAFDTIGALTYGHQLGFMKSDATDIENLMANLERTMWLNTVIGLLDFVGIVAQPWNLYFNMKVFGTIGKYDKLAEDQYRSEKSSKDSDDLELHGKPRPATFWDKVETLREKDPEAHKTYRMGVTRAQNMAAGSDTTSIALTTLLFHAIKDGTVWQKLVAELEEATSRGEVSNPITFDEAQKLNYLQYTIKECMRVHPSVGLPMWREVPASGAEVSGTFFPAGTWLGTNAFVAHYNRDVFGLDADEFKPERWDPTITPAEKLEAMEAYWMPFGLGSRTCIGKNIALLELNKLIPELLKRYQFELIEPADGVMRSENNWFAKQKNIIVQVQRRSTS